MIRGQCHCGAIHWTFQGVPESATACNCTLCRRYGTLWVYDYEGGRITTGGDPDALRTYIWGDKSIGFHFCGKCGCVSHWRGLAPNDDGRRRIAVNLRLADPADVIAIPLDEFDGLDSWTDLPSRGRCVGDIWF